MHKAVVVEMLSSVQITGKSGTVDCIMKEVLKLLSNKSTLQWQLIQLSAYLFLTLINITLRHVSSIFHDFYNLWACEFGPRSRRCFNCGSVAPLYDTCSNSLHSISIDMYFGNLVSKYFTKKPQSKHQYKPSRIHISKFTVLILKTYLPVSPKPVLYF